MMASCIRNIDIAFKIQLSYLICIFFKLGWPCERFTGLRHVLQLVPTKASSLPLVTCCRYYSTKRFIYETNGFFCTYGTLSLVQNEAPTDYHLYTFGTIESMEFLTYVCMYNNRFMFTSFGVYLSLIRLFVEETEGSIRSELKNKSIITSVI